MTGCMEVAGARVHPAQDGALLFHVTEGDFEGRVQKCSPSAHGASPGAGGGSGSLASDRFSRSSSSAT